jgi:hypothetical protein
MKVEVEVVVLRAPGAEQSDSDEEEDEEKHGSAEDSPSSKSSEQGSAIDWQKELQGLQEEFGEPDVEVESEVESIPDGLGGQRIGNVHDAYNKRTALGLGGTAFFVPDVERYAMAPSLLPPPPRGQGYQILTGHKRLKLKPRLPLEVSRNRWRDEHPYGCPMEPEFSPDLDDLRQFEEKVRRVELYGTLNKFITTMPKPDGLRRLPKRDDVFEWELDQELKNSQAWQTYIKRQRLIEIARQEKAAIERGEDPKAARTALAPPKKEFDPTSWSPDDHWGEEEVKVVKKKKRRKPPPVRLPPHPGGPPLKFPGFQVGQVIGQKSEKTSRKSPLLQFVTTDAESQSKASQDKTRLPADRKDALESASDDKKGRKKGAEK